MLPYLEEGVRVQYDYLFRFGSLRDKLDKEVKELKGVQDGVATCVEADLMDGRQIKENVEKWLKDISDVLDEAESLKEEMKNKKGCFMGRTCWYTLSRRFKKKTSEIIELREKGDNYEEVSLPRAHLPIPYLSSNDFMLSESSKSALDQIMEGLKDETTKVIGLYGVAGVGKTTLVKLVIKLVEDSKQFDKVVMVVVSQTPDLMAIQDKVAAVLGLDFEDENDVSKKAYRLKSLLAKENNILIILDDIWEMIELSDIGITFTADQKCCKTLLTTSYHKLCPLMKCEKEIHINGVCETEAWDLFKERAYLNDASLMIDTAKEVAIDCGGLPMIIVPLARVLVNNTPNQWKDALQCLRNSNLAGVKNIDDKNAYKCLKLCYDKLNGEEIKLCFLMCSLFPKDYEIEIELLVRYAWGLSVCKYAETIYEARIKVKSSIDNLKDYCLLINNGTNKVKMHDVVRHFALWIAFNAEKNFTVGYISKRSAISKSLEAYMAISLIIKGTRELPNGLVCQNLKLLLLCGDDATIVSNTFFEQMKALQVLTISSCSLTPYLPDISTNLRVLSLEECKVGNISSLGNLKKLEILRFFRSDLRELPDEIGEMKELKVLDLSSCEHLERIPAGLIEKLSCLEKLYVIGSPFKLWEARLVDTDSSSSSRARLSKLNSLSKLSVLFLDNIDECLLPDYFVLPNLTKFDIIGKRWRSPNYYSLSQTLEINEVNYTSLHAFKMFFPTAEHLVMKKNDGMRCIVPAVKPGVFNNLISLELSFWKKMVCLIDTTVKKVPTTVFQNLKKLTLYGMESLKEVCRGQTPNEFLQKLETISIQECPKLRSIFQVHEELRKEDKFTLFSTLIDYCRKLTSIFSFSTARTLVHLQTLEISNCVELEHIIEEEENFEESSTSMSHLILTQLVKVSIRRCKKLKCIFPNFVAPSCLQQLKKIYLGGNVALEQIFKCAEGNETEIELSHLEELTIEGSPKLVNFSEGYCSALSFPSLHILDITDCTIRFPPRLKAKQLQYVFLSKVPNQWWNYINISQLNLKEFRAEFLIGVEEVIRIEVDDERSDLVLPMKDLQLNALPQLAHICNCPSYTSILQNLKHLQISSCHNLSYILSPTLAQNLPKLKYLKVNDCKELVQVIGNDNEGVPNHLQLEAFPSLQEIEIKNRNKIKFVFPLSVVGGLPNLQKLDIQNADGVEYIFGNETLEEGKDGLEKEEVVLPRLKEIVLKELPSFRGFSTARYNFIFPLIKRKYQLEVGGCPNITESFTKCFVSR